MKLETWAQTVRDELEAEFAPRRKRAMEDWPVILRDETIADVPCLVVEPSTELFSRRRAPSRTLFYLFGGGYVSGSPETDLPIIAPLACLTGMRMVAPRYLLAPEHPFPAALNQVVNVFNALNPDALCGESAGGGLALALLQKAKARPDRLVLFSPWTDLSPDGIAACAGMADPTMSADDLSNFAKCYASDLENPLVSPSFAPDVESLPPVFLTTGENDILRNDVLGLHEKLVAASHDATLLDMPGMCHVFEVYDEFAEARESLTKAAAFLTEQSR